MLLDNRRNTAAISQLMNKTYFEINYWFNFQMTLVIIVIWTINPANNSLKQFYEIELNFNDISYMAKVV